MSATFPFEDFTRLDIRVGKVVEAKRMEGSRKLLILKIDVGGVIKQSVSGIAEFYQPDTLVGKSVVVVTNLPPKKLFGMDSEVMILAAYDGTNLSYLSPEREVPPGTKVS
jgi:methionine--tRNA ligase beta chain